MARLIGADALRIVTQGKNHHRKYVFADITDAPTIDAIPVEWLREKANGNDFVIGRAARFILRAWEQEAQDG